MATLDSLAKFTIKAVPKYGCEPILSKQAHTYSMSLTDGNASHNLGHKIPAKKHMRTYSRYKNQLDKLMTKTDHQQGN